jgi:acetyltransferase-like isoleucine patch superfamily enzyme
MYKNDNNLKLGKDVFIGNNCVFDKIYKESQCGMFTFGDYCSIHENCRFYFSDADFSMGDYGTIHNNTFLTGYKHCKMGHNVWIGQNSIINATDQLTIGNNCGIGAYSKIWTHAAWGDLILGCRVGVGLPDFESKSGAVTIGDDFWGIGQITISPGIKIGNKVIALTHSLLTKDVPDNTIVGGTPAKPIAIDGDFKSYKDLTENEKFDMMKKFANQFSKLKKIRLNIDDKSKIIKLGNNEIVIRCGAGQLIDNDPSITYFDLIKRTYTKKYGVLEHEFMKFMITYKAKFIPE